MRYATALMLLAPVMLAATPALAGEEVLYGPAPDWIDTEGAATIDTAAKLANIRGEPNIIKRRKATPSLLDLITEKVSQFSERGRVESPLQYRTPLVP